MLRQVLTAFETCCQPRTLTQLARELDVSPGLLEGMIDYWVRKGRLRERTGPGACGSCGGAAGCPFAPVLPRSYELVPDDALPVLNSPSCACCE